jgi:hypothetical protein
MALLIALVPLDFIQLADVAGIQHLVHLGRHAGPHARQLFRFLSGFYPSRDRY